MFFMTPALENGGEACSAMVWWVGRQETEDGQVQEWIPIGSEVQTSLGTSGKADLKLDHVWGESLTGPDETTQPTRLETVPILSNPQTCFQPQWPSFVHLASLQCIPFFFFLRTVPTLVLGSFWKLCPDPKGWAHGLGKRPETHSGLFLFTIRKDVCVLSADEGAMVTQEASERPVVQPQAAAICSRPADSPAEQGWWHLSS